VDALIMSHDEHNTDALFDFPCDFPIKIMGRTQEGFAQSIAEVIVRHAPDFDIATVEMRSSSGGNYLSLTCTVRAHSRAQLDAIYGELTSHPMVVMAL
jgi:putative lipoic acid-binding regulatory protein